MPIFYDCATAPSPRRARILLAEKGIAVQTVEVDLRNNEQLGEAYKAINPQCTVPALKLDDGTVLPDNAAIWAWAEAVQPEPALLGRTPVEKALVASWNSRIEGEGLFAIAEALRNTSPALKDRALTGASNVPQIAELGERGRLRALRFFETLNAHLDGREFVAGAQFSLADITAAVMLDFARVIRFKPLETHPHLARWRAALGARPSMGL